MIWTNIGQVTILSLAFLLIFIAFNTCQNFASKILKDDGFESLGFISLAVLYLVFSFCGFFSTAIINKINNLKMALFIGSACYTFWIICFIPPALFHEGKIKLGGYKIIISFTLILSAAINGVGAGILWVA